MAIAAVLAAFLLFAPITFTSINFVAPSPSFTIILASARHTNFKAPAKTSNSRLFSTIIALAANPLAIIITLSFVLICPSILMQLKVSSTTSFKALVSAVLFIKASVVTKHSIVAILGHIIPAPLAIAATVTVLFLILISTATCFAKVSVVIIALTALCALLNPSPLTSLGKDFIIFSLGRYLPITPVEDIKISIEGNFSSFARDLLIKSASSSPLLPVQQLALPLFTIIA